jgi:hypothetical protein
VGALDRPDYERWYRRLFGHDPPPAGWTAYAQFDDDVEPVAGGGVLAGGGSLRETAPQALHAGRVAIGGPERVGGTAVVALTVHEDSVSLHFHHLGPQQPSLEGFSEAVRSLRPPTLRDDAGTTYEPSGDSPAGASSSGGSPDDQQRAIGGRWLYTPAAPEDARVFTAERDGQVWRLVG